MRNDLEAQTADLMAAVVEMGELVDQMLGDAVRGLVDANTALAANVVSMERRVDRLYERVQHGVVAVLALQGPVGHDLRVLTALIHVSLHLERMGDYALNVARTAERVHELPADADLSAQLSEMADLARKVGREGMRAFVAGDVELARKTPDLDDPVDRLNIGIFHRLVRLAADGERLEWATRMILLARLLERYGDHGVDIAEQAIFAATGEAVELSSNDVP